MPDSSLSALADTARALLPLAHAPYSRRPGAVVLFDAAGRWIPGVRVENGSYGLTIPALRNALTTAAALRLGPVVALATTQPLTEGEEIELRQALGEGLQPRGEGVWCRDDVLPVPGPRVSPFLDQPPLASPEAGIALARQVAEGAVVPESDFRVGCVAELGDGRLVPGVNVERADWSHILCAERNALGTIVSYGLPPAEALYVACLPCDCSPCGACRQVITELAPEARIWMPRNGSPLISTAAALLPERFTGEALSR